MLKLFCIHDSKAGIYDDLRLYRSSGEAIRAFGAATEDNKTMLNKFPQDYSLWEVGSFSQQTGELECLKVPVCHGKVIDLRPEADNTLPMFNTKPLPNAQASH